jgi:hypothetical protein
MGRLASRPGLQGVCILGLLYVLASPACGQLVGLKQAIEDTRIQQLHQIGLALFAYSNDNNQNFPDGASSTEVFQKLLDGNYITDPGVFFIPLPGKTKALGGQRLKPENVCFDVTCCVDADVSDALPLVFITGYKVTYVPGGSAVPRARPYPPGIIAYYKGANSRLILPDSASDASGSIANFIPTDFDPRGKTYHQLTPEGRMPP